MQLMDFYTGRVLPSMWGPVRRCASFQPVSDPVPIGTVEAGGRSVEQTILDSPSCQTKNSVLAGTGCNVLPGRQTIRTMMPHKILYI